MRHTRLRTRLVAAFVGIAALTTLVAALLTSIGLHRSFDGYVEQRTSEAGRSAARAAESAYRSEGDRWTPTGLDLLSHELVLTGYDFRLIVDGRTLLDTTKLDRPGSDFRRVSTLAVNSAPDGRVGTLELYALTGAGETPADDALRRELDRGHIIAAAIAAIVAVLAGLIVAGRLSRPLRHLAAAARGLSQGGRVTPPSGGSLEVQELAESLDGLAVDLERQRRARRQLAQDLSHELRTPLMLLQSRIEAMQDGVVPFGREGLALLHTETLRLGRLVGQIELLAEAEAQPPPMRPEILDVHDLAVEAHASLASAFETRGIDLRLETTPVSAFADRDAVRQILTNLLSNALKYAPEGQPVRLVTGPAQGSARVVVHDQGTISADERGRVFERFYRGSERTTGGAGLGLTIARSLAEAQGGSLDVDVGDEGTAFVVSLPLFDQQSARASPTADAPAAS